MHILEAVDYQWDSGKARLNFRKHGIYFADGVTVLEDERALTIRDASPDEEERWITLGMDSMGRVLVVIYTWPGRGIRLISARRATPGERHEYEESL